MISEAGKFDPRRSKPKRRGRGRPKNETAATYEAEDIALAARGSENARRVLNHKEIITFANHIYNDEIFQSLSGFDRSAGRFEIRGGLRPFKAEVVKGLSYPGIGDAVGLAWIEENKVQFSGSYPVTKYIVIHEMAHMAGFVEHDDQFRYRLIQFCNKFIGKSFTKTLEESFNSLHLGWSK